MARQKQEIYTVRLYGIDFDVTVEIHKPSFGTFDCPGDNGSIEIIDIKHSGVSVFELVSEIKNYEELIIDEIHKQL